MKIRLKKFLNKYKNRIFSFIAVIACIPFLSINSFAAYSTYPQYDCTIPFVFSFQVFNGAQYYSNMIKGDDTNYHLTQGQGWVNDSDIYISTFLSNTSETDDKFYFPINTNLFDYYLVTTISVDQVSEVFTISDFDLGNFVSYQPISFESSNILTDKKVYYSKYDIAQGSNGGIQSINCTAKLNLDYVGDLSLGVIYFKDVNGGLYESTKFFTCSVIVSNKGDTSAYNDIIASINNQTDVLGGYIDKGNSSTGGIVSGNNSAIDNLDEVVSEYHATEQQFFDDFNSNQQAITSDIVGWSWGGLVNCANWVGDTMTDYYNNMGDFRQYIIYPLMLGIALFFLGRGGSIIGHLFRKPTTTFTHTESRSVMSNGVRHTNTVSTRNGGVFRK